MQPQCTLKCKVNFMSARRYELVMTPHQANISEKPKWINNQEQNKFSWHVSVMPPTCSPCSTINGLLQVCSSSSQPDGKGNLTRGSTLTAIIRMKVRKQLLQELPSKKGLPEEPGPEIRHICEQSSSGAWWKLAHSWVGRWDAEDSFK